LTLDRLDELTINVWINN